MKLIDFSYSKKNSFVTIRTDSGSTFHVRPSKIDFVRIDQLSDDFYNIFVYTTGTHFVLQVDSVQMNEFLNVIKE